MTSSPFHSFFLSSPSPFPSTLSLSLPPSHFLSDPLPPPPRSRGYSRYNFPFIKVSETEIHCFTVSRGTIFLLPHFPPPPFSSPSSFLSLLHSLHASTPLFLSTYSFKFFLFISLLPLFFFFFILIILLSFLFLFF